MHLRHEFCTETDASLSRKKEKTPSSELLGERSLTDSVIRFASVMTEEEPVCGFSTKVPQWYLFRT